MDDATRAALRRAKERLDPLELYPRPVATAHVRVWVVPWLFRLPWLRRFDGYSAHWTILLRSEALLDDADLVAHELCHVWQMQHHPLRMPLSYLLRGYDGNPYELEARRAAGSKPGSVSYTDPMAQAPALPAGFELPLEPRLPRIGSVDAVALEERAASLAKRSIKKDAKVFALELAIRTTDLTTLEGADTPGKVAALCSKAIRPDPSDPAIPSCAAICVYPNLVPTARERLEGTGVKVAAVATGFPSGQYPTKLKVADVRNAIELGAEEIDMVIDRGAFLSGRYAKVYDEVVQVKEACGDVHLKVILETGELGTYDNVRRATLLAIAGGADFVKTSTGKINPAATLPVALCMLEAVRDVYEETGRHIGFKAAGGIRQAKQAVQHLVLVHETLGADWLTPDLYRLGASSLLNDILMQLRKEKTGVYQGPDYFTLD
ncbi:MAG TPA: deoxyribose-phosphate aldolase [Gaiellaceae bacterium]|nr:deoxyribose-phosphate aldolase [Gaiellaceae bacterium]